ncbi:MAG: TIGR00282 family metallophosphoesterase [Fimbriimonadaceae bacterium]|nr:TIGR00282 family metallophosphoesterase [Chthonomonadaceae bacterium]MCO5296117.1 TIGR00282 family metallophosphoesterase [Fimbriimonadaceae bacterium]
MTYRILFLGDVVGKPGREALRLGLPTLRDRHAPSFTVVNGENSAGGVGITPAIAEEFFDLGIDAITLGNHAFNKREIYPYLDGDRPIVRPANLPKAAPGRGWVAVEKEGIRLAVANVCGRVFLDGYDDPFPAIERILEEAQTPHLLLDFHAEATSEKIAMSLYLDGRATAVLGTHTHVTTADERVLPGGTATITDVGMTGPIDSVLGMDPSVILKRFLTSLPQRFEVADKPGVISGVVLDVERVTGRARSIERVRWVHPDAARGRNE